MKRIVITQSNYIPWKGYFDAMRTADVFVYYDDVQYTRRDWRNRNLIKTANGLQWLTVPVEVKGKYHQRINEVRISDREWGSDHWNAIENSYRKATYFKTHSEPFKALYLSHQFEYLTQVNYAFIDLICTMLNIDVDKKTSADYVIDTTDRTERLIEICKAEGATDYYTGPAAKNYIDEADFLTNGIRLHYLDYSGYQTYRQLHGEFVHGVSIIDLIFNEGPHAAKFLKAAQP